MFGTEECGVFTEFGPSAYYSTRRRLASWTLPRDGKSRRKLIRSEAPASPGVYGMIDADGQLIYVGKSKRLISRLMSYFPARSSGEKSERIGRRAVRLVWETAAHELLALLRELELIRRFSPRFNVEGRPERQRPAYIYLTPGPAPFFRVGGKIPSGCTTWFGPLQGVGRYTSAVEQLNRRFLLRDCPQKTPMKFAEQRELFEIERQAACLRYELNTCFGPCAALCTSQEYALGVERALAFLRGEELSLLAELERSMLEAAASRQFERAAALRDAWRQMALIARGMERLRELRRNFSFVYELRCQGNQPYWIFIRSGHAVGAHRKPSGPRSAVAVARRLQEIYEPPEDSSAAGDELDLDMLRVVGGWFHHHEEEIKSTQTYEDALRYCHDLTQGRTVGVTRGRSATALQRAAATG